MSTTPTALAVGGIVRDLSVLLVGAVVSLAHVNPGRYQMVITAQQPATKRSPAYTTFDELWTGRMAQTYPSDHAVGDVRIEALP